MELLIDRTTIIALAIAGACLATAGSLLRSRSRNTARLAHLILWVGYLVSLTTVVLFVAAGFLSNRRYCPTISRRFQCSRAHDICGERQGYAVYCLASIALGLVGSSGPGPQRHSILEFHPLYTSRMLNFGVSSVDAHCVFAERRFPPPSSVAPPKYHSLPSLHLLDHTGLHSG
jgi:hypothetical protein